VIVQWNQKDLTFLEESAEGYEQSKERIENLGRTIRDMNNTPSVCVFEDIRTGGGGERALTEIVKYLNDPQNTSDNTSTFETSGEVNPMSRRRELYAVLWRESIMGDLLADETENGHRLMTNDLTLTLTLTLRQAQEHTPEPPPRRHKLGGSP
jgi:hypothetical protein